MPRFLGFPLGPLLLLSVLLPLTGCNRVDLREAGDKDLQTQVTQAVSYTQWQGRNASAAPELFFYSHGKGRLLQPNGNSYWFDWKAEPGQRQLALDFKEARFGQPKLPVSQDFRQIQYQGLTLEKKGHLTALNVLTQSGQITAWLIIEGGLVVVGLFICANVILYLNNLDGKLKRGIKLRGSDLGFYLQQEKPEFVSLNHGAPMPYRFHDYQIDVGGIHVNIETAELVEEGEMPLFRVRSGTTLRFYRDAEAVERVSSGA
ncbi:MAG: hypothetical protein AAGK14_12335 [Verrucomicrobiota bacterium]